MILVFRIGTGVLSKLIINFNRIETYSENFNEIKKYYYYSIIQHKLNFGTFQIFQIGDKSKTRFLPLPECNLAQR